MIETPESIWINVVETDVDEYKAVHGYAHRCPKGAEYILKSTVDKERDDILELWEVDVKDHEKTIAALAEALEIIAGYKQCIDNLMGNIDIAKQALTIHAKIIKQAQDNIK